MDYRGTLNLPKTDFPMKADLPKREPQRVEWWNEQGTYERRLERNAPGGAWILHDGPPYANGELHMGHFLNMVLKDMFVKIALLDGKYAKFVPGWDMHGCRSSTKRSSIWESRIFTPSIRSNCASSARSARSTGSTVSASSGGAWAPSGFIDHPYRTIDPSFEATIVNALADLAERQQIYKGLRSTLWCIHDETALAEAEIEYEQRTSPSIYVRFTANDEQRVCHHERLRPSTPLRSEANDCDPSRSSSGRRRRGRFRQTSRSHCAPTQPTDSIAWTARC
jgi:isoleucyl-tRNA synthetase